METYLSELKEVKGKVEAVIDVSPSPGAVGLVLANFLVEFMKSERIAELYSPYFPQVSVVNNDGVASLPKVEVHLLESDDGKRMLLIVRNFFVDSVEGGTESAELLYRYISKLNSGPLIVMASGRLTGSGEVYVSSSSLESNRPLIQLGAKTTPQLDALPVDRLSSFLLLNCILDHKPAHVLISDTSSYGPDLVAVRRVISLLSKYLQIELDIEKIDKEIERQRALIEEFEKGFVEERREREGPPSYIG